MGNEKTSENIFTYSKFTSQVYIMHNLLGLDLFPASFLTIIISNVIFQEAVFSVF